VNWLIATRIRLGWHRSTSIGAHCFRVIPGLLAAVMIQNTLVEIEAAVIRDWRMYCANTCMMAWCKSSMTP
jgi:hypothetical protein